MAQRLFRISALPMLILVLVLGGGAASPDGDDSDARGPLLARLGSQPSAANAQPELLSTIVFSSTRHDTTINPLLASEIYLINPDPLLANQNPRRLTNNTGRDLFGVLSPDGKWIVFDSDRLRAAGEPANTSDLFVMKNDGKAQTHVFRGSSATWAPDSRKLAYHASASGTGLPIRMDPGAPTGDTHIFVAVGDFLDGTAQRTNITNNGATFIEEDADWSPDGQWIAYTRHPSSDPVGPNSNYRTKDIFVQRVGSDGSPVGEPQQLTFSNFLPSPAPPFTPADVFTGEDRAPSWSPNGDRLLYMCRRPARTGGALVFQLCVLDKLKDANGNWDGTSWEVEKQLTTLVGGQAKQYLGTAWSPDGTQIAFHRAGTVGQGDIQLFRISLNPAGTWDMDGNCLTTCVDQEQQLTYPTEGRNGFAEWGRVRHVGPPATVTLTPTATATPSSTATSTPIPTATSTPSLTPTATPTGP